MAASRFAFMLMVLVISPEAVEAVTAAKVTTATPQELDPNHGNTGSVTSDMCFSNAHPLFEPNKDNIKRIICPFLSSVINEGRLPIKKFYTKEELKQLVVSIGLPEFGETTATGNSVLVNTNMHSNGVFAYNAPSLMNLFNMEGNPNEHNASTGANDCESIYPCDDGFTAHTGCRHKPFNRGRQTPFPIPVPMPEGIPYPMDGSPMYRYFCPDIVDHLTKCIQTSRCDCVIPNEDKFVAFWNAADHNHDGLITHEELEELQGAFDAPVAASNHLMPSEDLNPAGMMGGSVGDAYTLLMQVFGTPQKTGDGHTENAFNIAQLRSIVVDRKFPAGFTFPPGTKCYNDPNEALNQNDYADVASMSKAWSLGSATPFPIDSQTKCKDRSGGLSQLTGEIFFGKGSITTTLRGSGTGYLDFGNCGSQGEVSVSLAGKTLVVVGQTSNCPSPGCTLVPNLYPSVVAEFPFTDGQALQLSAQNGGVIRLNFLGLNGTTACTAAATAAASSPCDPTPRLHSEEDLGTQNEKANEEFELQLGMFTLFAMGTLGAVVAVAWKRMHARNTQAVAIDETYREVQAEAGLEGSRLVPDVYE